MLLPLSQDESAGLDRAGASPLMASSTISSSFSSSSSSKSKSKSRLKSIKATAAGAQVFRTCSAFPEYFARVVDYRQMDLDATFYQMVTLCVQPSKVYKSAYYRKQTKNRWARDDPAFAVIQLLFLLVRTSLVCLQWLVVLSTHPRSLSYTITCTCTRSRLWHGP